MNNTQRDKTPTREPCARCAGQAIKLARRVPGVLSLDYSAGARFVWLCAACFAKPWPTLDED